MQKVGLLKNFNLLLERGHLLIKLGLKLGKFKITAVFNLN